MTPFKTAQRPVTPDSVKTLMVLEALVAGFLGFWLYSEYLNNLYFQALVNTAFLQHITTYAMVISIAIGLTGSLATASLWRNLRQARLRLETATPSKMKRNVEKVLLNVPLLDEHTTPILAIPPEMILEPLAQPVQAGVAGQQKK
jgi:hypothetical protein